MAERVATNAELVVRSLGVAAARPRAHVLGLAVTVVLATATMPGRAQAVRYEHRVAVSTTALDTEREVEASLERNVNLLGADGYEVTAIVGGQGAVLDQLLERKPYVAGQVDHGGHAFVIMARPVGRSAPPRRYRLLHTRGHVGVAPIVAGLGESGHRLVASATDGGYFHAAFEQSADAPREYRLFANRGRSSWMTQLQGDAAVLARLSRVVPMGLDHALVELAPEPAAPGALEWFTVGAHLFASSDAKLQARTAEGFRVQMVRVRGNDVDVLLVRPAGAPRPATYDLEDAPWGMPCARGAIAGADLFTDGDTYCAAERVEPSVSNRGIDLRIRSESLAGGRLLFDVPGCEAQAQLGSGRTAVRRLVLAAQLERELDAKTPAGFRVTRAFAGADASGDRRLTVFTTSHPAPVLSQTSASRASDPALTADRDELLQGTSARLEDLLTSALAAEPLLWNALLWVEIPAEAARTVRLAGCVRTAQDKALAETTLGRLLVRTALDRAPIRNDVIVDPWR